MIETNFKSIKIEFYHKINKKLYYFENIESIECIINLIDFFSSEIIFILHHDTTKARGKIDMLLN
jgi:hypothetical protein